MLKLFERVISVFHRIVQQRCDNRGGIHADLSANRRYGKRVSNVRFARLTKNTVMQLRRGLIGTVDENNIRFRVNLAMNSQHRFQNRIIFCTILPRQASSQTSTHRTNPRGRPITHYAPLPPLEEGRPGVSDLPKLQLRE